eukprot:scaffold6167_cov44-Cyclotella_meneghiniana.AAC.3
MSKIFPPKIFYFSSLFTYIITAIPNRLLHMKSFMHRGSRGFHCVPETQQRASRDQPSTDNEPWPTH